MKVPTTEEPAIYLVWRNKPHAQWRDARGYVHDPGTFSLEVSLEDNRRTEAGPRRSTVAYLGQVHCLACDEILDPDEAGITTNQAASRSFRRRYIQLYRTRFWDKLTERLDRMGDRLAPEQRHSIEAQVAERVPRPE